MNAVRALFAEGWESSPLHLIGVAWLVWAMSWLAAALWSRRTSSRANFADEAPYRIVTLLGVALAFGFFDLDRFGFGWATSDAANWMMLALVLLGLAFAWWARLYLGSLWSGTVTRKEGHRIVDTGPYGLVRHPIYTGIIVSVFATAIARGRAETLLGAALVALGCWMKARVEERFLAEGLGVEAYAAYRARVPMLIPFTGGRS